MRLQRKLKCIYLFKWTFLVSLDRYPEIKLLNHTVTIFSFFDYLPYWFPQCLDQFTFPLKMHKGFLFYTSLPTFVICCLFERSHSNRCEVISHCGFDLHFLDDKWCWASFYEHIGYAFFGKMSTYNWSWSMLLLMYWIQFANEWFKISPSMFIRDIGL